MWSGQAIGGSNSNVLLVMSDDDEDARVCPMTDETDGGGRTDRQASHRCLAAPFDLGSSST